MVCKNATSTLPNEDQNHFIIIIIIIIKSQETKQTMSKPHLEKTKYDFVDNPEDFSQWNSVSITDILSSSSSSSSSSSVVYPVCKSKEAERVYPIMRFPTTVYSATSFIVSISNEHAIIDIINGILDQQNQSVAYSVSPECCWKVAFAYEDEDGLIACNMTIHLYRFSFDEEEGKWIFAIEARRENGGDAQVFFSLYDVVKTELEDVVATESHLRETQEDNFLKEEYRSFYQKKCHPDDDDDDITIPFPDMPDLSSSELLSSHFAPVRRRRESRSMWEENDQEKMTEKENNNPLFLENLMDVVCHMDDSSWQVAHAIWALRYMHHECSLKKKEVMVQHKSYACFVDKLSLLAESERELPYKPASDMLCFLK